MQETQEPFLQHSEKQLLRGYLNSLHPFEQAQIEDMSIELLARGLLHDTIVVTPIAAHQESPETVRHAIDLYAAQKECRPFSLVLGLNFPSGEHEHPNIEKLAATIDDAQRETGLDIRVLTKQYDYPTIGHIRRDLWNAVVAARAEAPDGRLGIGISHDIDLIDMSPHFISDIQSHYDRLSTTTVLAPYLMPSATLGKHAYDERYPNISRIAFWQDTIARMQGSGYEAGTVIPLAYYASHDGINADNQTHEIGSLVHSYNLPSEKGLTHSRATSATSLRRYITRLQDNDIDHIWTTDSFGADDSCRVVLPPNDISHDRFEDLIANALDFEVDAYILAEANREMRSFPIDIEKVERIGRKNLLIAQRALRAIGLPDYADYLHLEYGWIPESHAKSAKTYNEAFLAFDEIKRTALRVQSVDD